MRAAAPGHERALERAPDSAGEHETVEEAGNPTARLVLDDESIDESLAARLEVAVVERVRQAGLRCP
jgi:hypothetical protein